MIRTLLLCGLLAAPFSAAQAQTTTNATTPGPATTVAPVEPEPVLIAGCEDFGDQCSEGSGRASALTGSGAYIDQIGSSNRATISQRRGSNRTFAAVSQLGDDNVAVISQDSASAYAAIAQAGDENSASVTQSGSANNTALISQRGDGNQADVAQTSGFIGHVAAIQQTGYRNSISLNQGGEDNSAILTQDGDDNSMSVSQTSSGNALTWAQAGSNLGGSVTMDGESRALTIMQSNMYSPR